ncbi:2,5-diamino-6-(ribosylamino)-4(3H)-pyrimidinone 5'-phosphate reductase [Desulfobotulus alkaliphilus]|uniref:2,5-diamino-6-(Ribosylamino)-4(3H)-pyrimidinone 5'-phosphate reductase n=1 Tax=Desulfobotulus alkaliphilus TaxID=622671 RepID=A0A562RS34_9BACT|nr:RibD family protein [Desulfobotulus alkaliphilus]TWI71733.1 2,5-diamino-6-(ribosylamino)-4(3H)-pyrimidinone 5'-phosphate reductase [Desulfobotulus alkaliphilus]
MPKTILIAAMTLCGHIGPQSFSSSEDRQHLEYWRDRSDASLMGAATLRDADPEMRGSGGILKENRIRAFISASGNIPFDGRRAFLHGPPPLIFTAEHLAEPLQKRAGSRAEVLVADTEGTGLNLKQVLDILKKKGVKTLLLEGGGGLNREALKQGIVDELLLTLCPVISGAPSAIPFVRSGTLFHETGLWHLAAHRAGKFGEVFLHYKKNKEIP